MKMVQAPIFHVNADDPEAVAFVTRLALDFRNTFNRDVMIDLVCYRRHGHNEADEPSATQPMMYQKIKQHPTPRKIYGDKLIAEGVVAAGDVTEMVNMYRDAMDRGDCVVEEWREIGKAALTWEPYLNHNWNDSYANKVELKRLGDLARRISTVPEEVHMHPRVEKSIPTVRKWRKVTNCSTGVRLRIWLTQHWWMKVFRCVCPVRMRDAVRSSIVTRLSITRATAPAMCR